MMKCGKCGKESFQMIFRETGGKIPGVGFPIGEWICGKCYDKWKETIQDDGSGKSAVSLMLHAAMEERSRILKIIDGLGIDKSDKSLLNYLKLKIKEVEE